jgi:hypothetical protein
VPGLVIEYGLQLSVTVVPTTERTVVFAFRYVPVTSRPTIMPVASVTTMEAPVVETVPVLLLDVVIVAA